MEKISFSYKYIIVLLSIILVLFRFFEPPVNILSWDVFGYYLYLPAKFIYNDLHLFNQEWLKELFDTYEPSSTFYQGVKLDNGGYAMKYSMGLAILYSPFFIIAYCIAQLFGFPADGFSLPFQYILASGGIINAIIGLLFFGKVLKYYFNNAITSILLLFIFFGTNYFQLTAFDGTLLSHNFLFTLYAILIFYIIKWHKKPDYKYSVFIGIICGLIILARPSEAVCMLIPALWGIYNRESLVNKLHLIKKNFSKIILLIFCILLVVTPQLLYWKHVTGKFLFYSYANPGEGFNFAAPYITNFLFSFRKGWLIYTPLMLFSLLGFYNLYRNKRNIFYAVLIFIIADIYIISSWSCWWYTGASYSSRSIVPAYILLSFPLGYFIERIKSSGILVRYIFLCIALLLIILNLFQTWQFENGVISKERMTKKYYFAIFGKTEVDEYDKKLLLVERTTETEEFFNNKQDYSIKPIYTNNFNEKTNTGSDTAGAFVMDENTQFSPGPNMKYSDITKCAHAWLVASAKIFIPAGYKDELPLLVVTFQHNDKNYKYRAKGVDTSRIKYNEWNEISMDYLTPEVFSTEDNLQVYIWHRGKEKVLADDIFVYAYEPK